MPRGSRPGLRRGSVQRRPAPCRLLDPATLRGAGRAGGYSAGAAHREQQHPADDDPVPSPARGAARHPRDAAFRLCAARRAVGLRPGPGGAASSKRFGPAGGFGPGCPARGPVRPGFGDHAGAAGLSRARPIRNRSPDGIVAGQPLRGRPPGQRGSRSAGPAGRRHCHRQPFCRTDRDPWDGGGLSRAWRAVGASLGHGAPTGAARSADDPRDKPDRLDVGLGDAGPGHCDGRFGPPPYRAAPGACPRAAGCGTRPCHGGGAARRAARQALGPGLERVDRPATPADPFRP